MAGKDPATQEMIKNMGYKENREMMKVYESMMDLPIYNVWAEKTTVKRKALGGKRYHPLAKRTYAYLVTKKGAENEQNRKCMLFFHGGGAVSGTPEMMGRIMNRYAAQSDVNIINVKYRLAPEAKAPLGITDAYAAFMDVRTNPKKWGCAPNKIGFFGESGGGYLTAGVGLMLAARD